MNLITVRFRYGVLVVLLFTAGVTLSCGGEAHEGGGTGVGITADLGKGCTGKCGTGDLEWCFDNSQPNCVSHYCVGSDPSATYCSELCDTDSQCADGYLCTEGCELDSSGQPYCVTEDDYAYLVSKGYCEE